MPQIVILAGPNGAGKSTLANRFVPPGVAFLNADNIAHTLMPVSEQNADIAAGRLLLARIDEAVRAKTSFALETNLANRTLSVRIPRWQEAGYTVSLVFVWIPSADLAVERVASRVRSGGHDIPETTIRRRYQKGLKAFLEVYQPLVNSWRLYDNSGLEDATLVAEGWVWQQETWKRIRLELPNEQQQ
ncbi:MAG: AAA family ATPase [Janthinobacterium lividum]